MTNWRGRAIAAIALAIVVLLQACAFGAKSTSLQSKQARVKRNQRKIKEYRYRIHIKEAERRTVLGQLAMVEERLDNAQERLNANNLRLADANAVLKATTERLVRAKRQLNRRQALLQRRIVDIYEGDDLNYIDVVLGSTNMWTFLSRAYYLQQILRADTTLISEVRALKAAIENDQVLQTSKVREIKSLGTQLISQRDQVASLANSKEQRIREIEHDVALDEQAAAELAQESEALQEQIRRIENTPAGIKRSARVFKGGLMFPVRGTVSSRFGYRVHPVTHVYKLHTGVDLRCRTGTPVCAAANGTVIVAGWNRAYGYMVVIDHGGHVSTLYGHNSRLLVNVGDDVKQGQVIARSGSTGYSTGPHCHFEKRVNGTPVNPGCP